MKKILIVVDMQEDFVTGALGSKEAQMIVPSLVSKVKAYLNEGSHVIFTQDTHGDDYLTTQEGKYLPVMHCKENTGGWKLIPELDSIKSENEHTVSCIKKYSFGTTEIGEELKRISLGNDFEVELVGVCTDICVVTNALLIKTIFPENKVIVDASCCAGITPKKHEEALSVMKSCQVDIINEN